MEFIDENFMLQNEPAKRLYEDIKKSPIIDFHCHLSPQEIYEDKVFTNIVDLWLGADHYKWRAMRAMGIPEEKITGVASKETKFEAWAQTVENLLGNPLYHWAHLELKEVFGWTKPLTSKNWKEAYNYLNDVIKQKQLSPRKLIKQFNVDFIGTTDSPLDNLEYHDKLRADSSFKTIVAPTFRPDQAFIGNDDFANFLTKISELTNIKITNYQDLLKAMEQRLDYFVKLGCKATDHSFLKLTYEPVNDEKMDQLLSKASAKNELTIKEIEQWQTTLFMDLCKMYAKNNLVVQVHFGAVRNNNQKMFESLGADSGYDSLTSQVDLEINLNSLLNSLEMQDSLPKMIFYNLNPSYNASLANTLANFQGNNLGIKSKLQFGAAWWFSDNKQGMLNQMIECGNQGILGNFVGMLTDSRSFLSYPRHDYFRRILCNLVGDWMQLGEIPADMEMASNFVNNIVYRNAREYFEVNNHGNEF